jgi:hypothetical protein
VAAIELDLPGGEVRVEPGGLVRDGAAQARSKREQEFAVRLKKLPGSAGIEEDVAAAFGGCVGPARPNVDVSAAMIDAEGFERSAGSRCEAVIVGGDATVRLAVAAGYRLESRC